MALNKLHSPSKYSFLLCNVHLFVRIRNNMFIVPQFSSVQSLSPVRLFVTPWIAARHRAQNMVATVLIMHVNNLEESKTILKMSSS